MKMSCETRKLDSANAAQRAFLKVGVCEDMCILTDHIAFCHPAAVLVKLTQIRVTGASLTFNFAHGARAPKTGCFLSEIFPSLDPSKRALNWALNLFSGNLAEGVFHAFCLGTKGSSQVPARITFRRIPNRGPAVCGLKSRSSTASFLSQLFGPFISSEHGYHGIVGRSASRSTYKALTRHCAFLGNTGRCNSREPTAITFPDWQSRLWNRGITLGIYFPSRPSGAPLSHQPCVLQHCAFDADSLQMHCLALKSPQESLRFHHTITPLGGSSK